MSFSDSSVPAPEPAPAPAGRTATLRAPALRRDAVVVALGVALLSAAVVVSTIRGRSNTTGDLDLTVYLVGIGSVVVLLAAGAGLRAVLADREAARDLMSWPLAFGTVGAGLMIALGLDDGTSTTYVSGCSVLALAVASYLLVPSAPPAVAGVLGVLTVYGQAFTDTVEVDTGDDNGFKTVAVGVLVFAALVTAIAWFLPPARTTVAVVVGAGAILAYTGILVAIVFASLFFGFGADFGDEGFGTGPVEPPSYDGDVYTVFALSAVMVAAWLALGYLTDGPGFKVLVVAMTATVFPAGLAVLAVEHPTGWALGAGVLGAAVLAAVALGARRRPQAG